jgi:DNA primase
MTITPGFLDELRHRLVLSDLVGRKVQWDKRKSNPRRRDYWGCCPFHHEKSPSFHVEDDKGRYYCFGCGAKGDAVTFVIETENLSFPEAVQSLAGLVGMTVPAPTPEAARQEKKRTERLDLMTAASEFYCRALRSPQGEGARAYLNRRGLGADIIDMFGLGFSPGTGKALLDHLTGLGAKPADLIEAGLAGQRDQNRPPYDYFRGRLMFPIRDRQGRTIGFGARALEPGAEPKYLNSPETPLFKKGRTLYNLDRARKAIRETGTLILSEGYMDVIALHRAGLEAAVAPLGTALTEDQLGEAWRLSPEPVLCFDGDEAGLKAAYRTLDLALPVLKPGHTLRFTLLPDGQDPDDVLRARGADALQDAVRGAIAVADLLWRRELNAAPVDTPERKAALELRLEEAARQITDQNLQFHFRQDLRTRAKSYFREQSQSAYARDRFQGRGGSSKQGNQFGSRFGGRGGFGVASASAELKASALAQATKSKTDTRASFDQVEAMVRQVQGHVTLRERGILAMALEFPSLAQRDVEHFAALSFEDPDHARLARAVLAAFESHEDLDREALRGHLDIEGLGDTVNAVLKCGLGRANRSLSGAHQSEQTDARWQNMIARHHIVSAKNTELWLALDALRDAFTEDNHNRLMDLCRQIAVVSDLPAKVGNETAGDAFG